jgi:hypothetical protein
VQRGLYCVAASVEAVYQRFPFVLQDGNGHRLSFARISLCAIDAQHPISYPQNRFTTNILIVDPFSGLELPSF